MASAELWLRQVAEAEDRFWEDRYREGLPELPALPAGVPVDPLLTTIAIAARLGCSESWVRQLLHAGRLPFREVTRHGVLTRVVPESAVVAYLQDSPLAVTSPKHP